MAQLIPEVTEEVRGALKHERYRHEDLCRDLGLTGSEGGFLGPMVNIMPFDQDLRFGESPATTRNLSAGPVVDLSMGVWGEIGGGAMSLVFEANPDLHDLRGLAEHQHRLTEFIKGVSADANRPIGLFDLLTPQERQELLVERNATARRVPEATVPRLFEEQAARTPQAIALVSRGRHHDIQRS
jgi:Non-ribosomal peptide synthetase modules and related proteins